MINKREAVIPVLLVAVLVLVIKYSEGIRAWSGNVLNSAMPVVTGFITAYVLNILMKKIEAVWFPKSGRRWVKQSRRGISIALSFLAVFAFIAVVAVLVIPEFINAVSAMVAGVPGFIQTVQKQLDSGSGQFEALQKMTDTLQLDIPSLLNKLMNTATAAMTVILNSMLGMMGSMANGLMNFLISAMFAIYVLGGKEKLAAQTRKVMRAYLSEKVIARCDHILSVIHASFTSFIVGQCVEAVIIGVLCAVGMLILQIPYAATVGVLIAVTALIPVVGAYIGAVLGAFMILTVSPVQALVFLIFISVLQQIENNLIYPRVVGSSMGLPGIWVLAAITIGGGLGGIVGMLASVPVAATLYQLFAEHIRSRLEQKGENIA